MDKPVEERVGHLREMVSQAQAINSWWKAKPKVVDDAVKKTLTKREQRWIDSPNPKDAEVIRQQAKSLCEFSNVVKSLIKYGEAAQVELKQLLDDKGHLKNNG